MFNKRFILTLCMVAIGLNAQAQKTGVLIMAHGGGQQWNQLIVDAAKPAAQKYDIEFAWGMADPHTLQAGITALEERGAQRIIAVPLFISSYSPIIRQTEFLFGMRDSLADAPMPVMHHGPDGGHHSAMMHSMPEEELTRLDISAEIVMTAALDNHQVVARILNERMEELSNNPAKETVLLVAHGPNDEHDNREWVSTMESLIHQIQHSREQSGKAAFKQMYGLTVRDDAPDEIFEQAKEQLRALVRQSSFTGDVLVVPLFLSSGGRESAVAERLSGLDFKWSGKTLLPHPGLSEFIEQSIESAISSQNF